MSQPEPNRIPQGCVGPEGWVIRISGGFTRGNVMTQPRGSCHTMGNRRVNLVRSVRDSPAAERECYGEREQARISGRKYRGWCKP
jgi:hypothetical protein